MPIEQAWLTVQAMEMVMVMAMAMVMVTDDADCALCRRWQ
jgi:hypothetical protein